MGTIYSRLGTEVTVLEILPTALPGSDRELAPRLELHPEKTGAQDSDPIRLESCEKSDGRIVLKGTNLKTNTPFEFAAEKVLLAAGRRPNSDGSAEGTPLLAP